MLSTLRTSLIPCTPPFAQTPIDRITGASETLLVAVETIKQVCQKDIYTPFSVICECLCVCVCVCLCVGGGNSVHLCVCMYAILTAASCQWT